MDDVAPPFRHRWGPWVLLAGFLLAALGGVTRSDCVLCTPTELLPVLVGSALMLVGAAMWIFRRDRRPLARVLAVVLVTVVAYVLAVVVRVAVLDLVWDGAHLEQDET
ncbi:MAG TPA: hypothetical protein VK906_03085 [Egicoccus sp.]|nr:hypothetical protein [Egicoccus sp.]HSK22129.1 hypothetical protein [Egicoccus sp.]